VAANPRIALFRARQPVPAKQKGSHRFAAPAGRAASSPLADSNRRATSFPGYDDVGNPAPPRPEFQLNQAQIDELLAYLRTLER
jgi:hypothetical protein